jgi:hypothetical protein
MFNPTIEYLPCVSLGTIENHIRVYARFSESSYASIAKLRAKLKSSPDVINNVGGFLSKIGVLQDGEKEGRSISRRLTETGRGLALVLGRNDSDRAENEEACRLYWRYIVLSHERMRYWLEHLDGQNVDSKPLETIFLERVSTINARASAKLAIKMFGVAGLVAEHDKKYRTDPKVWDHEPELERLKRAIEKYKEQKVKPGLSVSYIEEGQLRVARKKLAEIMNDLSGEVRICDPYYGLGILDILEMIPPGCTVHFLTAKTNERRTKLDGPIADFRRDYPKTELRLFLDENVLHDRYILSDDRLILVGQGFKDLGNKESFVVAIPAKHAGDLIETIRRVFDERWERSTPLGAGAD